MIKNYLVTGDTHGKVAERLSHISHYNPQETAVIILGDAGLNFYLNKTDKKEKQLVQDSGFTVYCVRGNHEERPENIEGINRVYDPCIEGEVLVEDDYPDIRYLMDGHVYNFNGHSALVIGGAYSVDKYYRLSRFPSSAKWTGWFPDEQLTNAEMEKIGSARAGKYYEFVLSHTCPYSWMPTDLFLPGLDQRTVDNSMEKWLEEFQCTIDYDYWLFGHYHDDRILTPGIEMFYQDIDNLEDIVKRWNDPENINWWIKEYPNFVKGHEIINRRPRLSARI